MAKPNIFEMITPADAIKILNITEMRMELGEEAFLVRWNNTKTQVLAEGCPLDLVKEVEKLLFGKEL